MNVLLTYLLTYTVFSNSVHGLIARASFHCARARQKSFSFLGWRPQRRRRQNFGRPQT